jgi:hypothetical protein
VDIGPVIVGVFGGGALAALVAVLLKYRADNARTLAEASKVGAEGSATAGDALQRRYDALFDAQEREIARLGADLDRASSSEAAATADVRVARDEVVRLQHRLDVLELEG